MRLDLKSLTLVTYENRDHGAALDLMSAMCRLADFGDAKLLNHFQGWKQFNYWENYETWRFVTTDYALVVHLDGYIVHPEKWDSAWLEYDYIGAPWPHQEVGVGNGGFCLKSRRLMNRVASLPWQDMPGDLLICSYYRQTLVREGYRFAPVSVAAQFSVEHPVPETPSATFGFHGDWNYPKWTTH
jgi:hypothetical protein